MSTSLAGLNDPDVILITSLIRGTLPIGDLLALVDTIISDKDSYRALLRRHGEQAQTVLDALQEVLPSLPQSRKAGVLKAQLRLSKRSALLPSSFYLRKIKNIQRVIGTPNVDIYRGHSNGQVVCLKKYRFHTGNTEHDQIIELLYREAIIWANHRHVGVLPFIGVYQRDDCPFDSGLYLVSPFLERGTIIEYLKAFPYANKHLLTNDVLAALEYLHHNSIVHGDIKGANILIGASGRACIADLGFSRLRNASAILTWTTIQSIASVGTVPWQAPELLKAHCNGTMLTPTPPADVYSVGCLVYEMFTGMAPFWDVYPGGPTAWRVYQIVNEVVAHDRRPEKPKHWAEANQSALTEGIWNFMEICWHRDPLLRPTASQLLRLDPFIGILDERPSPSEA